MMIIFMCHYLAHNLPRYQGEQLISKTKLNKALIEHKISIE